MPNKKEYFNILQAARPCQQATLMNRYKFRQNVLHDFYVSYQQEDGEYYQYSQWIMRGPTEFIYITLQQLCQLVSIACRTGILDCRQYINIFLITNLSSWSPSSWKTSYVTNDGTKKESTGATAQNKIIISSPPNLTACIKLATMYSTNELATMHSTNELATMHSTNELATMHSTNELALNCKELFDITDFIPPYDCIVCLSTILTQSSLSQLMNIILCC